jgi:hypothetical protein
MKWATHLYESPICFVNGGRSRDRTYDLTIKSRLLYQLSYAPVLLSELITFIYKRTQAESQVERWVICLRFPSPETVG